MSGLSLDIDYRAQQDFALQLACELPAQGVTAVYGASGSGKTTLLDCIAGLRRPESGSRIHYQGEAWQKHPVFIPPWQRGTGYVFQDARLFPHLSVKGNLDYAQRRAQGKSGANLEQVTQLLELQPLLSRNVATLSAGQQQRVAIARALLNAPRLLLLDEPLANLDHAAAQQCLAYLQRLENELQLPMLYVSHDIEEISQLADHLILLDQGRLVGQGSLLELCTRLDTRLSHEEQAAAIAQCTITRHDAQFGLTELDLEGQPLLVSHLSQAPGQARRVRIPARDVSVCRARPTDSSILNILPVTLTEIEQTSNARLLLRLSLGSQHLLARITRKSAHQLQLQVGDRLYAQVKSAALLMEATDHV